MHRPLTALLLALLATGAARADPLTDALRAASSLAITSRAAVRSGSRDEGRGP